MSYRNSPEPALPLDRVRLADGTEATVNSACYADYTVDPPRMQFSICGGDTYPGPLFYTDESELLHRCVFKADPITKIRRCSCGDVPAVAYLYGPGPNR